MQKTLIIDGKEITFKANASLTYVYKNQFGRDLLTSLMPLISDILNGLDGIFEKMKSEKSFEVLPSDIAGLLEGVYTLELVDVQNIIWTMAKVADKEIKEPVLWYSQFEEFALYDVAVELAPMLLSSLISKKKLQTSTEKLKQLAGK